MRRQEDMSVCHGCVFSTRNSMWLSVSVLVLLLQETSGQIVTQTPSTVVSKLNGNATLSCRFSHTPDQEVKGVILYWYRRGPKNQDEYAYPTSHALPEYQNRVQTIERSKTAEDKSMVLLNVSWTDCHRYHCLLSYDIGKKPERKRGSGVLLQLYDSMTFGRVPEMGSSLRCSVRVSPDPGFRLSMFQNGEYVHTAYTVTPSPNYSTLSLILPILDGVRYECRLNHSSDVLLREAYYIPELPEPVFLYVAILLVPFIVCVIFLTVLLIQSRH
ncbi:hypothetical protein COCON_G00002420 [Conger conger]|uniref:Ig-like domain-containing protein n=1 Tax=Conger conger TaxID=82655 RepID=A0A9Q1E0V5_CONCO|nr:hypothetical protein COCON_G00002420 [Conger conger]